MGKLEKVLEANITAAPSTWRARAEWRKENEQWLKKSQQIAMAILDCMDELAINQKDLAKKLNVSPQYVNKILKGAQNLSLDRITKLEVALNISLISVNQFVARQKIQSVGRWSNPSFSNIKRSKNLSMNYDSSWMSIENHNDRAA